MKSLWRGWSWGSGLVAAVALGGGLLASATPADAQQNCTAALDIDVHYCKGGPPGCDPLEFTDNMDVQISVEVTNDSEYAVPPAPGNPPSGILLNGATIKVYYACSVATCFAGEERPGVFDFVSVDSSLPEVSFVDDGNGYSGTITMIADLAYAAGQPNPAKELVRLNVIAKQPPALPDEIVFARAGQPGPPAFDDSSNAMLVTDPLCLQGALGGGQGSTVGIFASAQPADEFGFCRHPNKQTIKIDREGSNEYSNNRVAFVAPPDYDPSMCGFHFGYKNANGNVYTWTDLNAGDLIPTTAPPPGGTAGCYLHQDNAAKALGGVQLARVCQMTDGRWCFNFKGWADFDANLTLADMPLTLSVPGGAAGCGGTYEGPAAPTWNIFSNKWILPRRVWVGP